MNSDTWKSNFGCFIEKFDHGFPSIIAKFLLYLTSVMRSTLKTIKKCDEKWRKSFLNLSSTHYLSETSKTRNSSFRYPNRPVYSVDRVLTEIDVLFSSIEQKSLCAEIWWNPHEIPVRPRKKEAKVGSSTYTKVFWLSLFSVLDVVRP